MNNLAVFETRLLRLRWLAAAARLQLAMRRHDRALKANFNPNQPRVAAGNPDGGRWTDFGGRASNAGSREGTVLSDATSDGGWNPGAQYAQAGPRGARGAILINGQRVQPTPGQAAALAVVEARAQSALRRVQDIFPEWRPTPSLYRSIEGRISALRAEAEQAEARIAEFQRYGILPGLFARESIPARGPDRDYRLSERRDINAIGNLFGCHTCGTVDPGTRLNNYVVDHQYPTALNPIGRPQRLYPQCATCSARQGGWISRDKGERR